MNGLLGDLEPAPTFKSGHAKNVLREIGLDILAMSERR